jgi:methylenetetrahydrofolate reductase (NADPH)
MGLGTPSVGASGGYRVHDVVRELLRDGGRSFSFEFFPPRDDEAERQLWQVIRRLECLAPTFVSVTYGAGGSTRDRTTRITGAIARDTTLTPVAHLTCVGASRAELRRIVGGYADRGVFNVLALRGDPPGGPASPWTPHPEGFDHAVDLVTLLRSLGRFSIGVAATPNGHPESPDLEHDARVLRMKADAGAEYAITQFFFDPEDYFRFRDLADRFGVTIPIIPGIMPLTNTSQIERFAVLSGTPLPPAAAERVRAVAQDPAAVREVGVDLATRLCRDLLDGGAPGLHFYTLNRSTATLEVFRRLGVSARRPVPGSGHRSG